MFVASLTFEPDTQELQLLAQNIAAGTLEGRYRQLRILRLKVDGAGVITEIQSGNTVRLL
ncbi:hypothetical protein D3C73_1621310 [compost metagenome]